MEIKTDSTPTQPVWDVTERDAFGRLTSMTSWPESPSCESRPHIVLVPVDGSPASTHAVDVACRIIKQRPNGKLHLINVQVYVGADAMIDSLERQGLYDTLTARSALNEIGEHYQLHLVTGIPAEQIRAYARQHGVAEIVIGSRGTGQIERLLIGSVAMDVAEKAQIPVTLVKDPDNEPISRQDDGDWLLPCDGSEHSLRALDYAIEHLSHANKQAKLHLVHVQRSKAAPPPVAHKDAPQEQASQADIPCAAAIARIEKASPAFAYAHHIEAGDPAERIRSLAEQLGCERIIMGSRGLGIIGTLVLGSVSQTVAKHADIPVTLVK